MVAGSEHFLRLPLAGNYFGLAGTLFLHSHFYRRYTFQVKFTSVTTLNITVVFAILAQSHATLFNTSTETIALQPKQQLLKQCLSNCGFGCSTKAVLKQLRIWVQYYGFSGCIK